MHLCYAESAMHLCYAESAMHLKVGSCPNNEKSVQFLCLSYSV